ncbi:hypothetical protein A0H81_09159 [Grifola frondosa]|uniref:Uncharacterized protein n=1 Tax=Grifola frondosa TaxID=5627 RepID=A0A1C7M0W7_GRIFR|nr:hypothetical protein A0H81_09159 [Grifola frondosa]
MLTTDVEGDPQDTHVANQPDTADMSASMLNPSILHSSAEATSDQLMSASNTCSGGRGPHNIQHWAPTGNAAAVMSLAKSSSNNATKPDEILNPGYISDNVIYGGKPMLFWIVAHAKMLWFFTFGGDPHEHVNIGFVPLRECDKDAVISQLRNFACPKQGTRHHNKHLIC